MSFNGSGTFNLPGSALQAGDLVSATEHNQLRNDMASGFTECITRSGQSPATANIPMGGYKITGMAEGAALTDAAAVSQIVKLERNQQSQNRTLVLADAGKFLFHPSSDATARTFTIPANASVNFEIGTVISFINETAQVLTIAINSDTLVLAGTTTTGSRSLGQNGVATAIKIEATKWIISGTGLY